MDKKTNFGKEVGLSEEEIELNAKILFEKKTISSTLAIKRIEENLTQVELANKLGASQSFVSKIENADNDQINFGDVSKYLNALGYQAGLEIIKPATITEKIKQTFAKLVDQVEEFQNLECDDKVVLQEMLKFDNIMIKHLNKLSLELVKSSEKKLEKITKTLK